MLRGILSRENPTYTYWPPIAAARRGFKMVLFTASRRNNFVGCTFALPSALLVYTESKKTYHSSLRHNFGKMSTDFQNYFTVGLSNKFAAVSLLYLPLSYTWH